MIKPIDLKDLPPQGKYAAGLKKEIEEFLKSGLPAGEVELGERKASSVTASIKTYINRYGYPMRVLQKSGRVFVIRTDLGGEQ